MQAMAKATLNLYLSLSRARAGDGYTGCSPSMQLAELSGSYETDGPSRVACSEGASVTYPAGAPGFAYDPIGDANAAGSPHAVRSALPNPTQYYHKSISTTSTCIAIRILLA